MGAFELNYSSDIDLIVFFDPAALSLAPGTEAQALYIRVTRGLVKLLQERTADGYVFRVDVRLRPDPASTHIAISTPAALEYYETRGQNWERSAMIKARPCAGDIAAGEKLLRELSPFVWRKSMDFAALADIHAMKRQIHAYKGHGEIAVAGHNIKLGRGGIREIEFFVQTQQLIAGGRHPELRDRGTLPILHRLADGGWILPAAAQELQHAYHFLRTVEHRLQMIADEQTHTLPDGEEELTQLARFLGFADAAAFSERLLTELHVVQRHYSRLFEQAAPDEQFALSFPKDADHRETLDRLAAKGFRNPLEVSAHVREWLSGKYPALRSDAARTQLQALIPVLLDQLSQGEHRDTTFQVFDRFLAKLPPGTAGQLFPSLTQNRELLALILLIIGTAPRLADTLAHHPQVIDALIDPKFFGAIPDRDTLKAELARSLDQASSYEDFLDRLRLFGQEHLFLIGARILSGTVFAGQAGEAFARLAEVLIEALHHATEKRFAEQHGRVSGQGTAVLAMGKLGGREMTAGSDLDLILVYDFDEGQPHSDGPKALYGGQYFARLTQRLISALTAPTNYGALYQVDMRLRPSGRSGPVATQLSAFRDYQETEAWTWEHMALTRARIVSASGTFGERVEAAIRDVLCRERDAVTIAGDAAEMRRAIAREKGEDNLWDLKYAAGGLIDVEFIAQYLQLVHAAAHPEILDTATARVLDKAARFGLLAPEDAEVLRPAVRLYQDLSQILRLCLSGPFDPKEAGTGLLGLLTRAGDVPDFPTLEAHLAETQGAVRKSFLRIIGEA
jgi:glutamate-ammonia-ligase adenylyltransferase